MDEIMTNETFKELDCAMSQLWNYLSAIQMQDIEKNDGVERFRKAREQYNRACAEIEKLKTEVSHA